MSLPDDLSPAEEVALERLLHEVKSDPHADNSASELEQEREVGRGGGEPPSLDIVEQAPQILDTETGEGVWNKHGFRLSEEQLKRVHAIFTECIAEKLTAEIERLRGCVAPDAIPS